ncbi:Radical SAM domain protein [Chlorobium limicola DSM 245]|uniref:Radical SAM domain protein n=2 Tax=Chlorobium limicola TaxID=1092 RepID=B3EF84_CHLL2|nr:Radical SAM domain protein [Chlorobium limicola DSM 245]
MKQYLIMKTPRSVDIDITNRCNLRCRHCYYYSSDAETPTELETAEWLRFFRELNECSVLRVVLAGGEPFMREDFRELIDGIVKNRMRFGILSNGTLVTDAIASFLAATRRCDYVQVSIDGSTPGIHDRLRGTGSFLQAVRGIELLRKHAINVVVRVTVTRWNIDDLRPLAAFLLDDLGFPAFSTNAASHLGLCRSHTDDVQLDTADRTKAMQILVELEKEYPGRITADAGPYADAKTFASMEQARIDQQGNMPGRGTLSGCGCIFMSLAVRADGVIVPCNMLSHIELGRINRDSLRDLWQNNPVLLQMRNRVTIPLTDFEFCKDCDYRNFCTGNCPALAYTTFGLIDHPSPDACLKRFLEEGGRLPELHDASTQSL